MISKRKIYFFAFLSIFVILLLKLNKPSNKQSINKNIFKNKYKKKTVIYECYGGCGGWADRLKGIMSSYAWSLITDRYFIIHHSKPCQLTEFLLPNEYNWNIGFIINSTNSFYYETIDNENFRLNLETYNNFDSEKENIIIKNNLEWLLPLSNNKNLFEKLKSLGFIFEIKNQTQNRFRIQYLFKNWYKKLFKLNKRLEDKYNEFLKKAKPNSQTKLICAQIRIGGAREFVSHDAMFTHRNNSRIYWNYIKDNFIKKLNNNQNYKIFITTDTKNVEKEALDEFGNEKVLINEGDNVHLDRESNCDKSDKVFLDFHCLQNCDMAIVSESGFGKLGVWNRNEPNENFVMFSKQSKIVMFNSTSDLFIL